MFPTWLFFPLIRPKGYFKVWIPEKCSLYIPQKNWTYSMNL